MDRGEGEKNPTDRKRNSLVRALSTRTMVQYDESVSRRRFSTSFGRMMVTRVVTVVTWHRGMSLSISRIICSDVFVPNTAEGGHFSILFPIRSLSSSLSWSRAIGRKYTL